MAACCKSNQMHSSLGSSRSIKRVTSPTTSCNTEPHLQCTKSNYYSSLLMLIQDNCQANRRTGSLDCQRTSCSCSSCSSCSCTSCTTGGSRIVIRCWWIDRFIARRTRCYLLAALLSTPTIPQSHHFHSKASRQAQEGRLPSDLVSPDA